MRVVIVHNRYRSENPSGENRVVESDIAQLRADGVDVYPYIRDSDEIANWTAVGKASLTVRPLVSPADAIAFRQMLRRVRPDIVHLHNPFPIISPWIVRTAKAERIPVVQTVHNYRHVCVNGIQFRDGHLCTDCVGKTFPWPAVQHGCYQGSRSRSLPMAAAVTAHRGTWDLVDRFLPVGEAVADHLRALGVPDYRIEVRPNVVDDPGEPAPLGEGVLFVGRLSEEKGVRLLLEAWHRSGLSNTTSLTVAGDGELRDEVEAAALSDPSIRYRGLLSGQDLDLEYRGCAVVAVPSLWSEPDPIAIVTALSHGRPVISSDLGSMPSTVGEDAGWIVAPDGATLAAGLRVALSDRGELERRSAGARHRYLVERAVKSGLALTGVYERLMRVPRGSLVIVGPDGSGKSAVVDGIRSLGMDAGVPVEIGHFRPGVVLPHGEPDGSQVTDPHAQPARSLVFAGVRTAVVWVDFLAGWFGPWRRASRRGLLLLERPWHDQAVDPVRYRLPVRLVALVEGLGWLMPLADAAVLLTGDPEHVHRRKPEIAVGEVERQQSRWRARLSRVARRTGEVASVGVPISATLSGVGAAVIAATTPAPTAWSRPFCFPSRIDLHLTSAPPVDATTLSIYAPQRPLAVLGARLGSVLWRLGIARRGYPPPVPFDALTARIGVQADGFAAMRSSASGRWVVGVEVGGKLEFVVKAGRGDDRGLQAEARFLKYLGSVKRSATLAWTVPELVLTDVVDDWMVVVTRAIPSRGPRQLPSLDEVAAIAGDLASGGVGGTPIVHGDLAPWNLRRGADGRWVVLDWEAAEFDRRPLWDLAHFVVQQGALLKAFSPSAAVAILTEPNSAGARHAASCQAAGDESGLVRDYLERSDAPSHPMAARYRSELEALLP